jgi:putative Holliday junction resolvase
LAAAPQTPRADDATVLGFDFGTKKIGVAVGNTVVRVAHPLATIHAEAAAERFAAIAALVAEWRPARLIVGRPVHADGTPHAMTERAERFARQLGGRFALPVAFADERYTTRIADAALRETGIAGSKRRAARDEVAAQIILQSWFDRLPDRARDESA